MKRIFCTLCAMALLLGGVMTTAFAAAAPTETPQAAEGDSNASPSPEVVTEMPIPTPVPVPLYPAEVRQSEENGITRIEKVYYLSSQDDPSAIPTEDFEREGKVYTLLDVLKQAQIESDTKDYTEVLTLDSDTQDMEKILTMLEPELEVQTEDGYQGVLSLDHTTITVEAAGYKTSSRTVSATRTYPNLSGADVSLIPKSITDSGRTLTLADVQWQEAATTQTDGYDMALRYLKNDRSAIAEKSSGPGSPPRPAAFCNRSIFQKFCWRHNRWIFHTRLQKIFVAGKEHIGLCRNRRTQDGAVIDIPDLCFRHVFVCWNRD